MTDESVAVGAEPEGDPRPDQHAGAAGFRAFVLSDIRGYSSFAAARGDEAAAALTGRFIAVAERMLGGLGGEGLGNRGDEVLFAFGSPRQAIRAAVAFELALLEATREDPSLPMPAGVGIDVGEAVVVPDGWRANAINVAARLCSLAKGGEILATREVTHLAQAIDGIRYAPRPATRVKGIAEPVSPVVVMSDAGDTAREFARLGFAHAEPPPPRRRSDRRALPVALATALIVAAAIVVVSVSGGSSSVHLAANDIGAVDTRDGQVTLALPIGTPPTSVIVGKDGAIWVASAAAGTLSRIDPNTHAITKIAVGSDPVALTVAPTDGSIWVADSGDGTISRVSAESDTVVASYSVGDGPSALVASNNSVWVANTLSASVSKIDVSSGKVQTLPVGSEPAGIAAGAGSVWVADQGDGTVYRLDQQTGGQVAAPVAVGNGPTGIAFGDGAAWVANSTDGTLSRIDPQSNTVTATFHVGQGPNDVAVGQGGVWVSDEYGNSVAQIDPGKLTVVGATPTNSAPLGLALAGDRLWVATDGTGAVAHRGGVLYAQASGLALGPGFGDPGGFDPGWAYTTYLWRVLVMTSDGLVGYRRTGGIAGNALVPDLAFALPVPTDQGLTYTFRIRSGIRYSNGAIVRASDFRRGLERAFRLAEFGFHGPVQYFTSLVGGEGCFQRPRACDLSHGIVADDATNTLTLHLVNPDPDLLYQLTLPAAYPVPAGTPLQLPPNASVPGTGPYEISSYTPAPSNNPHAHGRLVLSRNRYFRQWSAAAQPAGFPDQIIVRTNYSPASQVAAVEHGRTDVAWDPAPTADLNSLTQNFPTQIHESPLPATRFLWLNVHRPPFDNLLARQAFNYAIDRGALTSQDFDAAMLPGRPTCQLLPPDFPGYLQYCPYTLDPGASGRWLAPDLTKARTLVRQSGTSGAHVTFLTAAGPVAEEVVATLNSIGYRATLERLTQAEANGPQQQQLADQAEAGGTTWFADYVAPSDFFVPIVTCNAAKLGLAADNLGRFCTPRLDTQINKALAEQPQQPGLATEAWTAIDRTVANDAVLVPIFNLLEPDSVARRVGNFEYNPQWGVLVDQLWVR